MTRTTVTLESDAEALVKKLMRERDMSFKQAINHAIRAGLTSPDPRREPFRTKTYSMGARPGVNLDKANQLAGELEDEELLRRRARGE